MLVGYARISTRDQSPLLQRDELAGTPCDRIFEETASGAARKLPPLRLSWRPTFSAPVPDVLIKFIDAAPVKQAGFSRFGHRSFHVAAMEQFVHGHHDLAP